MDLQFQLEQQESFFTYLARRYPGLHPDEIRNETCVRLKRRTVDWTVSQAALIEKASRHVAWRMFRKLARCASPFSVIEDTARGDHCLNDVLDGSGLQKRLPSKFARRIDSLLDRMIDEEQRNLLAAEIAKLPAHDQELFRLFIAGNNLRQIGQLLGTSHGATRQRFCRLVGQLSRRLRGHRW